MHKGHSVSLVLPCLNEEAGVRATIEGIPHDRIDEIVVVDNNCTDRTADVARECGARVVRQPIPGYGAALRMGIASASGDIIVTMDGDNTYPTIAVPYLLDILTHDSLDFISAARIPVDMTQSWNNIQRYYGNMGLSLFVYLVHNVWLQDSQSGMWVFRRRVLDWLHPVSTGMPFSEEFKLLAFLSEEIAAREVPIQFTYKDRLGQSKLNLWGDGIRNALYLLHMRSPKYVMKEHLRHREGLVLPKSSESPDLLS